MITTDKLAIYLQDHLAGATFGTELARRLRDSNKGTAYHSALAELTREIEADRRALEELMADYSVGSDRIKNVVAWASEKAGRLKLNGQLTGYSPLSRVLELEGLLGGVRGKLALWRALQAGGHPAFPADRLEQLEARAEQQLDALQELHRSAARAAFGHGETPAAEGAADGRPQAPVTSR